MTIKDFYKTMDLMPEDYRKKVLKEIRPLLPQLIEDGFNLNPMQNWEDKNYKVLPGINLVYSPDHNTALLQVVNEEGRHFGPCIAWKNGFAYDKTFQDERGIRGLGLPNLRLTYLNGDGTIQKGNISMANAYPIWKALRKMEMYEKQIREALNELPWEDIGDGSKYRYSEKYHCTETIRAEDKFRNTTHIIKCDEGDGYLHSINENPFTPDNYDNGIVLGTKSDRFFKMEFAEDGSLLSYKEGLGDKYQGLTLEFFQDGSLKNRAIYNQDEVVSRQWREVKGGKMHIIPTPMRTIRKRKSGKLTWKRKKNGPPYPPIRILNTATWATSTRNGTAAPRSSPTMPNG